jgi:hypothetical protein
MEIIDVQMRCADLAFIYFKATLPACCRIVIRYGEEGVFCPTAL